MPAQLLHIIVACTVCKCTAGCSRTTRAERLLITIVCHQPCSTHLLLWATSAAASPTPSVHFALLLQIPSAAVGSQQRS